MTETRTHTYEALFLFPQSASADLQAAVDHITDILQRGQAEIIALRKWDERRLAFDIHGNKRGVYFLAYFKALTSGLSAIERDCRLSEKLLRSMITRADHVPETEIAAHDGRTQLADEIKMRGAPAEGAAAPAATVATDA